MKLMNYAISVWLMTVANVTLSYAEEEMDMHAHHHHHHMMPEEVKKSEITVELPKVQLVRQDGKSVQLADELTDGRIVVLSYIYTSCTAICPMTSQIIYKLQGKLGADLDKVHLVSISIDPEQDTPAVLTEYAKKFHASQYWDHYTGTEEASIQVQKSMHAYLGDKMNHVPVTFIWNGKGTTWKRIDGFATADDLLLEVNHLLGK